MKSRLLIFAALVAPAFGQGIRRVSVRPDGEQSNNENHGGSISGNARYVAFSSRADKLVSDDTNWHEDVFVRDNQTGSVERVSVSTQGQEGNNFSNGPSISARGRYVSFTSIATNFMPNDPQMTWDIFHHDRNTGVTRCVSLNVNGLQGGGDYNGTGQSSISADGRYVVFCSDKRDLSFSPPSLYQHGHVYVHDTWTGKTECASVAPSGVQGNDHSGGPSISGDGRYVAFGSSADNILPGWGSGASYIRDMKIGKTVVVAYGVVPSISLDARFVTFRNFSDTGISVYLRDMLLGITTLVSEGYYSRISPNGRYVAFGKDAEVFRWDRLTDETRVVSASASGVRGNGPSYLAAISSLGQVSFVSEADNLVGNDTNDVKDIFVKVP